MSGIIRINHRLEKIVKNPHFIKRNPFDYSKGENSAVDEALRKEKFKGKPLFRGGIKVRIHAKNIRRLTDYDYSKYQLLLVPVGFTANEADQTLGNIATELMKAFQKVAVQFSYLPTSVPIPINHIEHFAFPTQKESKPILRRLRKNTGAHGIAAVLNTNEYCGCGGKEVVFSGRNYYTLFLACHELGHHFGLDDGYERFYKKINSTELFTSFSALPKNVRYAIRKFEPPIYNTGNHFNGQAVYKVYKRSIMFAVEDNVLYYQERLAKGKKVFNDIQNHVMIAHAKRAMK